jgi:hypothetical protein
MNMKMQSEKYGELLQAIASLMVTKNIEIELLHEEISRLKQIILKAERTIRNEQK